MSDSPDIVDTRAVASRTLYDILHKDILSAAASVPSGNNARRGSVMLSVTPMTKDAPVASPEMVLSTNLKLSLNVWILLLFTQFAAVDPSFLASPSSENGNGGGGFGVQGGAAGATGSASGGIGGGGGGAEETLFHTLNASLDAIEDQVGWIPHTILLVRVLLVSLITKINGSSHKK